MSNKFWKMALGIGEIYSYVLNLAILMLNAVGNLKAMAI